MSRDLEPSTPDYHRFTPLTADPEYCVRCGGRRTNAMHEQSSVDEADSTGAYTLHWTTPSELYAGSVVPHWTTRFSRSEALEYARELIDGGQTTTVTLRSVEEIT